MYWILPSFMALLHNNDCKIAMNHGILAKEIFTRPEDVTAFNEIHKEVWTEVQRDTLYFKWSHVDVLKEFYERVIMTMRPEVYNFINTEFVSFVNYLVNGVRSEQKEILYRCDIPRIITSFARNPVCPNKQRIVVETSRMQDYYYFGKYYVVATKKWEEDLAGLGWIFIRINIKRNKKLADVYINFV